MRYIVLINLTIDHIEIKIISFNIINSKIQETGGNTIDIIAISFINIPNEFFMD